MDEASTGILRYKREGLEEFNLEKFFRDGIAQAMGSRARLNVMLAGRVGVGKSTLVNAIFGESIAATGVGPSITQKIERYVRPGFPISVYDTPGIELGVEAEAVAKKYLSEIRKQMEDDDTRIHFCLYCVRARDERFEDIEADIIRVLARDVLVVLSLTQCPSPDDERANKFAQYITSLGLPVLDRQCFLTLAEEDSFAGVRLPPFGLPELVNAIYKQLPEAQRHTLASYQRVSLELKVAEARRSVNFNTGTAALIAATPIPLVDSVPLSALQISMLGQISTIMGFKIDPKAVAAAFATVLGVTSMARTAASFFKIFPGTGTTVNATIASTTTKMLGEVFITACSNVLTRQMGGEKINDEDIVAELLKELPTMLTGAIKQISNT
ncbi:MAG TPA: GTPase [Pseudonocardiaceae bacterium]|nr:GTPase [Pseudonocardiaceae bacterium]